MSSQVLKSGFWEKWIGKVLLPDDLISQTCRRSEENGRAQEDGRFSERNTSDGTEGEYVGN